MFQALRVDPSEHPFVISEVPLNPKANRAKMAQVMFETFNVPALKVALTGILSLYASGRGCGIVVDSGDGVTSTIPIYEGYTFKHAIRRIDFGGRDLTHYLVKLLSNSGHHFATTAEREVVREMKEEICCVSKNCEEIDSKVTQNENYDLPDGRTVSLGKERFQCPEALFKPSLFGLEFSGIHEMIYNTLMDCDIDARSIFFNNILLFGGNTMFPSFSERIRSELINLAPKSIKVSTVAIPERKYSVWIGGSILGSLSSCGNIISKEEYDEFGPSITDRKRDE